MLYLLIFVICVPILAYSIIKLFNKIGKKHIEKRSNSKYSNIYCYLEEEVKKQNIVLEKKIYNLKKDYN